MQNLSMFVTYWTLLWFITKAFSLNNVVKISKLLLQTRSLDSSNWQTIRSKTPGLAVGEKSYFGRALPRLWCLLSASFKQVIAVLHDYGVRPSLEWNLSQRRRKHTGWHIRLWQTSCCHQNNSSIFNLAWPGQNGTFVMMCHPVYPSWKRD